MCKDDPLPLSQFYCNKPTMCYNSVARAKNKLKEFGGQTVTLSL